MSSAPHSRFWLLSGLSLFLVNVVLLGVNLACLAHLVSRRPLADENSAKALKAADHFGMDVGWVNSPLTVLVDRDFPRKDSFMLFDDSQRILIEGGPVIEEYDGEATRSVMISLDTDFALRCYYSLLKEFHVHELQLEKKGETLLDLNADGFYDLRMQFPPYPPRTQVWYKDQWRDVTREGEWSKYKRALRDGGSVEFDKERGRWLPVADEPAKKSS